MEENGENSPTPVRGQASSSLEDLSRSNNIEQLLNSENKSEQITTEDSPNLTNDPQVQDNSGNITSVVSSFLSANMSMISNLDPTILQAIAIQANKFETLKSQKLLDDVSYEQSVHSANRKVESIRNQLDSSLAHTQELRTKLAESQDAKTTLEKDLSSFKLDSSTTKEEVKSLSKKLDSVVAEKVQLQDRIEKKNIEFKDLQSEMEVLRKANVATRKSIIELESQAQHYRSSQISTKLREQNLEQEILLLKKNNDWLSSELETKNSDSNDFRIEKLGLIATLQSNLATLQSSVHSLENTNNTLKEQHSQTSVKLDDSLVRIKDLQDLQTTNEENFRLEMTSQKKLSELWERSATDAKNRVAELEKLIESERVRSVEDFNRLKAELTQEKEKVVKLENQLSSPDSHLEDTFVANENNPMSTPRVPRTPLSKGTPNLSGLFSPSAHIIADIQNGGGSLVQLYSDFQESKTRLEREKFKNQNLRDQMNNILEEMENQAPAILAEREENQRLESELAELSIQLEAATKQADDAQSQLKSHEIKMQDSALEAKLLSKQVTDLSRQVQQLLVQSELNSESQTPLTPEEHSALQKLLKGEDITQSDTDKLISDRLVLFTNTIELQRQNESLLKITRELGQKMEKEELEAKQKLEDVESFAVSEAKEMVKSLHSEINTLQTKLGALQRERDMFRRMLSRKNENGVPLDEIADSTPEAIANTHSQILVKQNEDLNMSLKECQEQFEAYKTETSVTIKTLDDQIVLLTNERSNLQIQLAKTDSQLELSTERFKNLEANFLSLRTENEEFKKRTNTLQESVLKQELRNQQISEEMVSTNSSLESLRNEAVNLKAEKSLWKSIEERLHKENADLIEERGRLNNLLANAQLVEAERASSATESQQRLSSQLSGFEEEIFALRSQLETKGEEVKDLNQLKETQAKEFQDRFDQLSSDLQSTHNSLLQAKEEQHQMEIKHHEILHELNTAKENVVLLEQAQLANSDSTAMTDEISGLKKSLNLASSEIETSKDRIAELQNTAVKAEEALQNMVQDYDLYKQETDKTLKTKENELLKVQDQFNAATDLLNSTQEELSFIKEEDAKKVSHYASEEKRLEGLLATLQQDESKFQESLQQVKDDMARQESIANDAQHNYEREVVKHADAANALQALRQEYTELKDQLLDLTTTAENASEQLLASESSWESQKDTYEQEIKELKLRTDSLNDQNKVLLDQLEGLSTQLAGRVDNPPSYTESAASEDQLREIISHLKREKEIVDAKFDLNAQELKRLKLKLDHTTAALDQSNLRFEVERQENDSKLRSSEEKENSTNQLNDINILRESNSTLRQQSATFSQKVNELEVELANQKAKFEPLEEQLRDALAEVKVKEEQIISSQKDGNKWKERAQQILQKYERIDPEELKALQAEIEFVKKSNSELTVELNNATQSSQEETKKLEEAHAKIKEYEDIEIKLRESEEKASKIQADYDAFGVRFTNLKNEFMEKMTKRRRDNTALKEQLAAATATNTTLMAELETANAAIASSATEGSEASHQLSADLEQAKQSLEKAETDLKLIQQTHESSVKEAESAQASLSTFQQEAIALKTELDAMRKEVEESKNAAETSEKESKEAKTKFEELSNEFNILKKSSEAVQLQLNSLQIEGNADKSSSVDNDTKDTQIAELENETKLLKDQILELEASRLNSADSLTADIVALESKKSDLEIQVSQLQNSNPLSEEVETLKATNTELENHVTTLLSQINEMNWNGNGTSNNQQMDNSNTELETQVAQLQAQLSELKEAANNTISLADLDTKLAEQRDNLQIAHSEAVASAVAEAEQKLTTSQSEIDNLKADLKQELIKENESRLAKLKTDTQQKMHNIIAQKTEVLKAQFEEEYKNKLVEFHNSNNSNSANPDLVQKLRDMMELEKEHKIAQFRSQAEEEKKKAVDQAREITKKETEMRLKLLQMKVDKAEKSKQELAAQLATYQGNAGITATGLTAAGVATTSGLPIPTHEPHHDVIPKATPSLQHPASGLTFQGASHIPRGGARLQGKPGVSNIPRTGIPRPGIPRTGVPVMSRNTRLGASALPVSGIPGPGVKRQMDSDQAAIQAQQELKRRKEAENKNGNANNNNGNNES